MSLLSSRDAVEDNVLGQRKLAATSAAAKCGVTCGLADGVAYHRGAPLSSLSRFAAPPRLIVLRNLHIMRLDVKRVLPRVLRV